MKIFLSLCTLLSLASNLVLAEDLSEPYVYIVYYSGENCGSTAVGVIPIVGDEGTSKR